ncbi:MAG: STAS domain-containing protein [Acidobacteria bacterium]|nr:STAS domain-containing protein [Acidobacteriota bacterium]
MTTSRIPQLLRQHQAALLDAWVKAQQAALTLRRDLLSDADLRIQSSDFLRSLTEACQSGDLGDIQGPAWAEVREFLSGVSGSRASQGFSPAETATFVFSLKQPLFSLLRREVAEPAALVEETWTATVLLDNLGLHTVDAFQKSRESIITRQQQELLELSTPVVQLWTGVLALPLIGTLDSARTHVVMESLLQAIVDTGASLAIIDITGVPTVDTLVAQHLMKAVAAARLMGAECVISGIRPQIAQTIVHLGVEMGSVLTKAKLSDALALAFQRLGLAVAKAPGRA